MPESRSARKESSMSFLVETAIACASFAVIPNSRWSKRVVSFRKEPYSVETRPGPFPFQLERIQSGKNQLRMEVYSRIDVEAFGGDFTVGFPAIQQELKEGVVIQILGRIVSARKLCGDTNLFREHDNVMSENK